MSVASGDPNGRVVVIMDAHPLMGDSAQTVIITRSAVSWIALGQKAYREAHASYLRLEWQLLGSAKPAAVMVLAETARQIYKDVVEIDGDVIWRGIRVGDAEPLQWVRTPDLQSLSK